MNDDLTQSVHLETGSNPIRMNLRDALESNQVMPTDWKLAVERRKDVVKKFHKMPQHQRIDAETSRSGVTPCVLHQVWGLSSTPTRPHQTWWINLSEGCSANGQHAMNGITQFDMAWRVYFFLFFRLNLNLSFCLKVYFSIFSNIYIYNFPILNILICALVSII